MHNNLLVNENIREEKAVAWSEKSLIFHDLFAMFLKD